MVDFRKAKMYYAGDKPTGPRGRKEGPDGDDRPGIDNQSFSNCSLPKAGVVIRATVEHMGLVGDTELTVSVKWPASTFCVPPCEKPADPADPVPDPQQVADNNPQAQRNDTLEVDADDSH
jgi:hypothetical protein